MKLLLKKAPQDLEARVLKSGLCCACGACIGLCPYFLVMQERVALTEPCGLTEGRCYDICPRTPTDLNALNREVFGRDRDDFVLGSHQSVLMSQSRDAGVREKGQYGGTVSSLIIHGLSAGLFDGAIMAGKSTRYSLLPEPILARSAEEVMAATGSKYTACPTLKILDKSLRQVKKLAVVGRPCQVIALRKRLMVEPELNEKIGMIVGIFCMWALNYKQLVGHLRAQMDLAGARKVDIPYNKFVVVTEEGPKELPFEPIRALRNPTCDLCYDFTSEFADVSVGSTEWKEDWNTLIVRTGRGTALVEEAKKAGRLAAEPLPPDRVELLRKASLGKKKRVLAELAKPGCAVGDYLVLGEAERQGI